jgi:hypothetical protein
MVRTRRQVNPSFDDPESFVLQIQKGVIHANIGDISNYLNSSSPPDAPLKNISLQPEGERLKLHGTIHKIFSLPIELVGTLTPTPDGRVQFNVTKLDVLKIPLKGLLGGFHVELSDLVHASTIPGVQIVYNDIIFDTQKLLPRRTSTVNLPPCESAHQTSKSSMATRATTRPALHGGITFSA